MSDYRIEVSFGGNSSAGIHYDAWQARLMRRCEDGDSIRAETWGSSEADVRAKCLAVQRIEQGFSADEAADRARTVVAWDAAAAAANSRCDRRDRFIAAAMVGWIDWLCEKRIRHDGEKHLRWVAELSVRVADSVLAEADKGGAT